VEVVVVKEGIEQLATVAVLFPRGGLACGQAKRHGAAECKDRVFAGEVVGRTLRHLDVVALQRVHHTKRGHQFTGRVHGDFELATRHGLHGLGQHFCAAENGVQRPWEARCEAPTHHGLRVYSRGHTGSQYTGNASIFNKGTTIHGFFSER